MSDYRIKFQFGQYELMTPCVIGTGRDKSQEYTAGWETIASAHFLWQLHLIRLKMAVRDWWWHRADGYDKLVRGKK